MRNITIKVENISKRYRIGLKEKLHDTFFGALTSWVRYPLSNFRRVQKLSKFNENGESEDIIWALRDVSLEAKQGEVLGIIGRNGAGKSTLLKIICRITEPTFGKIELYGRVASLLEVGTGFHPELTGRENVFLNGAILGMNKKEISNKFDEIIDFSGVEKFIDTPVKRYSSGMRVRLAFAVAAHLEPEILLIDEVLAVGDMEFQKKCLGKMSNIASEGRTVLFVSHNMGAIRQLCTRAILIQNGSQVKDGSPSDVIESYLTDIPSSNNNLQNTSIMYIQRLEFLDVLNHNSVYSIIGGQEGIFRIFFDTNNDILENVCITVVIYDMFGTKVAELSPLYTNQDSRFHELYGEGHIDCTIESIPLTCGLYRVNVAFDGTVNGNSFHDGLANGCELSIIQGDYLGTTASVEKMGGFVMLKQNWEF